MTSELVRAVSVDRLPASLVVEASAEECRALADRMRIEAVSSLWCRFALRRRGAVVEASGELRAEVVQACVVSLEPVAQSVEDAFTLRFVPAGTESPDDDPEAPDELPYEGSTIDLGEAAAEQLALALDPYPRHPDAALDSVVDEPEAGPLAALAALRRPS